MDPLLETYYDEYAYLFKSIYNFVKAPPRKKSEYLLYPNIARRVLESFLMFKLPKTESTLLDKAQTLAGDKNDPCLRSIMRLINNKSHLQVIPSKDYTDRSDELNILPDVLKNLLMFMRYHDTCHFDTLAKQFIPTYTETTFCMDILKEGLPPKTKVKLYSMAVCAGEGFEPEDDKFAYEEKEFDITLSEPFDYGVKISGRSMEPKIPDGSIVLVKKYPVPLNSKDIVICIYERECMCKRYIQTETSTMLTSDNRDKEKYPSKVLAEGVDCVIQGKVVRILSPSDIE